MSDIDRAAYALVVAFFGVLIGLPLFSLLVSAALVGSWWLAPPIGVGIIAAGVYKGRKDDARKAELQRNAEAARRDLIEAQEEAARQTSLRLAALDEQHRHLTHDLEVSRQRAIESAEAAREAKFRAEVAGEARRQVQDIIDGKALAEIGLADPLVLRRESDADLDPEVVIRRLTNPN